MGHFSNLDLSIASLSADTLEMSAQLARIRFAFVGMAVASTMLVGMAASSATAEAETVYFCHGREATKLGTPGNDVIQGTEGRDVIVALAGDDVIHGNGGNDVICGNNGADIIYGNGGADRIYGGKHADTIRGGPGSDFLYGQSGRDLIYGNNGHDRLYGGGSNDELRAGFGNDRVFGHGGDDALFGSRGADVCIGETESSCEVDYRGPRDEELWRPLVDEFFGDIGKTDDALVILRCESLGDPFAINPNGKRPVGLFQFIPTTWEWAAEFTGWSHETRMHPRAATETARWLYDWAETVTRRDGSDGQGFDPWVSCRCQLPDYRDLEACIPYR
jgi:Ca2+-binding RTX toxin-like protein